MPFRQKTGGFGFHEWIVLDSDLPFGVRACNNQASDVWDRIGRLNWDWICKVKPRLGWALLVPLAIAVGWGAFRFQFVPTHSVQSKPHSTKSPQAIAKPHLDLAEKRIDDATRNHFDALNQLFDRSRSQSKAFAKSALGWGSKWRIVADATPFTRGDRHPRYLKEQFELQVLKGDDLTKAIEQAVTEFLAEIRSLESQMLVDLRVDVEDLSQQYAIGQMDADQLQSHFDAAIENAKQVSGIDLQSNISSQLVSIVVGEVLTQVAVRLGVSAARNRREIGRRCR